MRPRVLAVGADGDEASVLGELRSSSCILPAHMRAEDTAECQHGERPGVVGIDRDRLLEQFLCREIVLAAHAPVVP